MVAAGMTIFVADCLEMVHVDEQHRNRLPVALGLSEAAHQPLVDGAAIERAGQGVELGRAPQLDRGQRWSTWTSARRPNSPASARPEARRGGEAGGGTGR